MVLHVLLYPSEYSPGNIREGMLFGEWKRSRDRMDRFIKRYYVGSKTQKRKYMHSLTFEYTHATRQSLRNICYSITIGMIIDFYYLIKEKKNELLYIYYIYNIYKFIKL